MIERSRIEVYDIESYLPLFLYCAFDIKTEKWFEFEISAYQNHLDGLVKHLVDGGIKYHVSFNGLSYDSQVLQFIIENHDRWGELSGLEIALRVKKFSDRRINDANYGLLPPYWEDRLENQQIDLFRIHHYDNENRRTSLKWLQFSMDLPSVEETPIPFDRTELSKEEVEQIKKYCRNDIISTVMFYNFTIGKTSHPVYKGRNKIQDRLDLIKELGFPNKALNWSDVKIGDEINKKTYMQLCGINDPRKLYDLKLKRKKKNFKYGDCIPPYVSFKTKPFQDFYERMLPIRVNLNEKEKFPFVYNGTHYVIAKGGIHSNESNRIIIPSDREILMDADVGSQYPHSLIKRRLFPSHLGEKWLIGYTGTRDKRLTYKEQANKPEITIERKQIYTGLAETYKLSLNGGGFGKTNERSNWQYDPFVHFSCTIGNQFEILMLIESLEIEGIHTVSANTDGIVCLFDKDKLDTYYKVCHEWEQKVGNSNQGKLEFTEYKKLIQSSVNHYIAIKENKKVKKKGSFATEFELNKDKSAVIIPIALEQYYLNDIPVEETIRKHKRIYDFCIGVKSSKEYHYEASDKTGEKEIYHRMVRYYISTNGKTLLKVKNPESEAPGNPVTNCEAGGWKCTVVNDIDEGDHIKSYKINHAYYIEKANEIINQIGRGKKMSKVNTNPNQISLF